jgi:hypothetical protein
MIIVPTDRCVIVGALAALVEDGDNLKAWAEHHIRTDPDLRWVLGNYVEADYPNDNGHIFPRADLLNAQATLAGKPLNMMHREHYIVGCFAGAQLHTDDGTVIASDATETEDGAWGERPYVEALAGMWHNRFPEEFFQIRKAHSEGALFFSMEAVPETVSCPSCGHDTPFAGIKSDTYCEHMNGATGPKRLHNPTFNGGAIIIPPVRPGWQRADVKEISKLMDPTTTESVHAQVAAEAAHLDPAMWEGLMAQLVKAASQPQMELLNLPSYPTTFVNNASTNTASGTVAWTVARDVSMKEREKLAEKNKALPDGGFPIANEADLKNAIRAVGRAKNPAAAKAHIKRRAKALGREDLIPPNW